MSATNPRQPDRTDESLEILKRLEPLLRDVQAEQRRQSDGMVRLEARVSAIDGELRELKGRVSQLPTLVQIIGSVLAINAGIVAIAFGLVNVLRAGH